MPFMKHPLLFSLTSILIATKAFCADPAAPTATIPQANYTWSQVSIGGGGAIPGIVLHPKVPDLAYIHTDVGGAYRWDAPTQTWIPLLESIPFTEWNLYGVDSLAVDPNDATGNTVYITTGKYSPLASWVKTPGMLMKSTDRGRTWTRLPLSPTGAANNDQDCGERLAVDPHNSDHIVYAARLGGFFSSLDAGATWTHVDSAPRGGQPNDPDPAQRGSGLAFALFDASSGTTGTPPCTRTMYIGATRDGVYQSTDGGQTWHRLEGGPINPRKGVIGSDGAIVVSHEKGVARDDGTQWSDITPPKKNPGDSGEGCAVAIDPNDPKRIAATLGAGAHAQVLLSTDSGKTWRNVLGRQDPTRAWWPAWHWFSNPFSLAFDPFHKDQVWATDWYGTYHTDDITADQPVWTNRVDGIEEVVTCGALLAPPGGKYRLFSGDADIGGLDHDSLTVPPKQGIWVKGVPIGLARTGLAIKASDPNFVVTVGTHNWSEPGNGAYSLDGGDTWKAFPSLPAKGIMGGRVVVAGPDRRILWVPQEKAPFYSDDLGATWTPVKCPEDLSASVVGHTIFFFDQPLALDAADPNRVYLLHGGNLFLSTDAGATFARISSNLPYDFTHKIATSGVPNDVWLCAAKGGLHRSTDGGATFTRIPGVESADLFCFGKAPSGQTFPALFVKGKVNGQSGYFRSDDEGKSWVEIDLPDERIGNDPNTMTGDWIEFGGVYVGTGGRGIYYGDTKLGADGR
jgi:photosystem II stability/assembly factor-like uncharacterized protein